jgi:hypothetical protein
VRGDYHAADRVEIDRRRDKREAIPQLRPQGFADRVDNRLVARVEDERNRVEREGANLALVELGELGYQRKELPERFDVPG